MHRGICTHSIQLQFDRNSWTEAFLFFCLFHRCGFPGLEAGTGRHAHFQAPTFTYTEALANTTKLNCSNSLDKRVDIFDIMVHLWSTWAPLWSDELFHWVSTFLVQTFDPIIDVIRLGLLHFAFLGFGGVGGFLLIARDQQPTLAEQPCHPLSTHDQLVVFCLQQLISWAFYSTSNTGSAINYISGSGAGM